MNGYLIAVITIVMVMYGTMTAAAWGTAWGNWHAHDAGGFCFWTAIASLLSVGAYISVASLLNG